MLLQPNIVKILKCSLTSTTSESVKPNAAKPIKPSWNKSNSSFWVQGHRLQAPPFYFCLRQPCLSFSPVEYKRNLCDLRGKQNRSAHVLESASFFTARSSLSWSSREITVATGPAVPVCVPTVINRDSSSSKYGDLPSISPCNTGIRYKQLYYVSLWD